MRRGAGCPKVSALCPKYLTYATRIHAQAGATTIRGELGDIQGAGHGKLAQAGIEVTDSGTSRVVRKRADSVEKIEGLEVLVKEASALLPASFVPRMMNDEWMFGLLLVTGHWLPMERIERVFKDCTAEIWMDVEALPRFKSEGFQGQEMSFVQVAEARTKVSVSVRQGGASDGTGGGVKNELSSVGAGWWESVSRSLFDGMQARFVVGADRDASDSGCAGEEPVRETERPKACESRAEAARQTG